ncbi:MAG: acyl-CoA thioesterase [Geminicoccaceae bacterium]
MAKPERPRRRDYPHFLTITSRWMDNDIYGHVNNVVYYSYFDTVINAYLMEAGGLDPWQDEIVGMAVDTGCRFHASVQFPDQITAGLRIGHLGNSSVRYEVGIFRNDDDLTAADGHFVHVFVRRGEQRPTPIPPGLRAAMERLLVNQQN